jgi:bla regulator protein BlaR1
MRVIAALALFAFCLAAQTASFEVVSVKPSGPDYQGMFIKPQQGGGIRILGATVKNLISIAYNVREFQIVGAPAWAGTEHFDIEAHSPSGANQREMLPRMQSLLADRFHLRVRREDKEQNIYALTVAKSGSKLREPAPDEQSLIRGRPGVITGTNTGMAMLVLNLSSQLGKSVVDLTGLTGKYDFKLEWTTDNAPATDQDRGPTLFTALQEQLGLRLDAQRGVVHMLVIDKVERPSEN